MATTTAALPSSPPSHRQSHSFPPPLSPTSNQPSLTYHNSLLPRSIPTPALLDSALGGAHYSGASGVESVNERRRSMRRLSRTPSDAPPNSPGLRRQSALPPVPNPFHLAVLDDLKDVRDLFSFERQLGG